MNGTSVPSGPNELWMGYAYLAIRPPASTIEPDLGWSDSVVEAVSIRAGKKRKAEMARYSTKMMANHVWGTS